MPVISRLVCDLPDADLPEIFAECCCAGSFQRLGGPWGLLAQGPVGKFLIVGLKGAQKKNNTAFRCLNAGNAFVCVLVSMVALCLEVDCEVLDVRQFALVL